MSARSISSAAELRGVWPALFTPLKNDDPKRLRNSIDYEKAKVMIDDLIAAGVDGLVPVGTTGQSPTVSPEQHLDMIRFTVDYADGRVPVIGHVFHTSAAIQAMFASSDLQVLQPLACGRPLPHVGAFYPQHPAAATSGYLGFVDVPAQLPDPVPVRIYAQLADGSLHLVQSLRTRLHDADGEKFAYAPHAPGDFDAALTSYRLALRDHPNDPKILQNIAIAYSRTGRLEEAIRAYRRALDAAPQLAGAHYGLAFLLLKRGDRAGAMSHLTAFLTHPPANAEMERWVRHAEQTLAALQSGSADVPSEPQS